jgi:hypothetical protein
MEEESCYVDKPVLALRCFAPEETSICTRARILVDKVGATIGRKAQNTASFCRRIRDWFVGIDRSISGERASINFREGILELRGTESTNGKWLRLSGLHEEILLIFLNDRVRSDSW